MLEWRHSGSKELFTSYNIVLNKKKKKEAWNCTNNKWRAHGHFSNRFFRSVLLKKLCCCWSKSKIIIQRYREFACTFFLFWGFFCVLMTSFETFTYHQIIYGQFQLNAWSWWWRAAIGQQHIARFVSITIGPQYWFRFR